MSNVIIEMGVTVDIESLIDAFGQLSHDDIFRVITGIEENAADYNLCLRLATHFVKEVAVEHQGEEFGPAESALINILREWQ